MHKLVGAAAALVLSVAYVAGVFHLRDGQFWVAALGDWHDPYFINALLEHWYHSMRIVADPASPPMFFPARHALGYSHGLIFFGAVYAPLRLVLHPFQAHNVTVLLTIEVGALSLYLLLRRLRASFVEALALGAFFVTSQNVINEWMGIWSQRASVFLIPPIVLVAVVSATMRSDGWRLALAGIAGMLATLLYVQDFYTAHFAALFAGLFAAAVLAVDRDGLPVISAELTRISRRSRTARVALIVCGLATAIAIWTFMFGGGELRILHMRLVARTWQRPAVLGLASAFVVIWLDAPLRHRLKSAAFNHWVVAFGAGAIAGGAVFLWIYLPAFREHPSFPANEVWDQLVSSDPYVTLRPFAFAAILLAASWVPFLHAERKTRLYVLWIAAVSAFVLAAPLKFGGFSLWTAFVGRLPGFSVIRDPKRIIYLYELALVISTAVVLAHSSSRGLRAIAVLAALGLTAVRWNPNVFDYGRPDAVFDRQVASPIAIDPSCRSFFLKGASRAYMARSGNMWSLYGVDATFVALQHSLPTLNGYSAWAPPTWDLWNPQEREAYPGRVQRWIADHRLSGVCELDIEARTMTPPRP